MLGQVSIEVVYLFRELLYKKDGNHRKNPEWSNKNDGLSKNTVQWKIGKSSQCAEYQSWWRTEVDIPRAFWGLS